MSFFSHLKNTVRESRGFTMIELLVVITILGILAVAVLSAINPIEQINRGRDTGSQSDAEQLIGAIERYNAFQGYYPWVDSASPTVNFDVPWTADVPVHVTTDTTPWLSTQVGLSQGTPCNVLDLLAEGTMNGQDQDCVGTNELKNTFINRISATDYNPLYVYHAGTTGSSTYVCFYPTSGAFKQEATMRCNANLPSDYPPSDVSCATDNPMVCLP